MKGRYGFTLIEMLVVIAIILIMMALMGVFVQGLITKARYADTATLIKALQTKCEDYHTDHGAYPPNDRGGSASLHYYLGRDRVQIMDVDGQTVVRRGRPYWQIPHRWLKTPSDPEVQPSALVDAWGNEIGYAYPGKYTRGGVDIWANGANGIAEMDFSHPDFDDVNTWVVDN